MSKKDKYGTMSDDHTNNNRDPRGVIGWVLAEKYKITRYVESGGFADVYEGHNTSLVEQRVIVKFLKRTQDAIKFHKEARILSVLYHPNICGIIDFCEEDRAIVFPFIDGENCERIVQESGPLTEKQFLTVSQTILDALVVAHENKIAHRDIKPSNIMIDRRGDVYLIDFGIAKEIGGTLTKTGYRALTPQFAAPERHRDEKGYNPFLSDVYELGATLYYLATNEMPYRSPHNPNRLEWGGPADKRLSGRLRQLLKKATHPDPAKRFQSVAEMAKQMARVQDVFRRRWPKYVTAVLFAALVVGGYSLRQQISDMWDIASAQFQEGFDSAPEFEIPPSEAITDSNKPVESGVAHVKDSAAVQQNDARQPPQPPPHRTESHRDAEVDKQKVEKEKPPPPPTLSIHVSPSDEVTLLVDGLPKEPGAASSLAAGHHDITVVHPDFPFLEERVNLKQDTNLSFDLNEYFARAESFGMQIGAFPPLTDALLRVSFNGKPKDFEKVPIRGLKRLLGKWQLRFDVVPEVSSTLQFVRVDSFTVRPGIAGPVEVIEGNEAIIDFSAAAWGERKRSKIVVYWTGQ